MRHADVLVVGGGGAALRAAIAAYDLHPDLTICLVTKGDLGQSGVTATACSDRMAFHATLDTTEPREPKAWRYHADDIYQIGGRVSDADLATVLARNAADAFAFLDGLGVPWARREDGSVDQFVTDGSAFARACYTGPHTATHIEEALVGRLRETGVQVWERAMVAEIITDDRGQVVGAAVLPEGGDEPVGVSATSVVLATGGAGQMYATNVFPSDCTGDGYALAYRAGAELVNLEFIQIGLSSLSTGLACSGSMMRALPRIIDERGSEFLPEYVKGDLARLYALLFAKGASWPISYREPSHLLDIAVDAERRRGVRTYLDYSRDPIGLSLDVLPASVRDWYCQAKGVDLSDHAAAGSPLKRLEAINRPSVAWLAERGIDLCGGDAVEIGPAVQHFQGGVKIRARAETTVAGLFAAGEVAGGQHGANRPGGNALLDAQVFGKIAGESAAKWSQSRTSRAPIVSDTLAGQVVGDLLDADGAPQDQVRRAVREAMAAGCGVYRTQSGLKRLAETLGELASGGVRGAKGAFSTAVETVNMVLAAQLVCSAANARRESRGPHLCFPEGDALEPLPRNDQDPPHYYVLVRGLHGPEVISREPVRPHE